MPKLRARTSADRCREAFFSGLLGKLPNKEIAKMIGKTAQTVRNYKTNPETMTIETAARLANAAGWTAEQWDALRRIYR